MADQTWSVYILQCADETLYTGITTDLDRRIQKHVDGKGAKYTRGRGPYKVLLCESHATKSSALMREAEIKALSKIDKLGISGAMGQKKGRKKRPFE